jgi:hypothetical protein
MSRHLIDHRATPSGGRQKHFFEAEKTTGEPGSNPATKVVHTRPVAREPGNRVRAFLRIARGIET